MKLELEPDLGLARVTVSERNLLSLLVKLRQPRSRRTLVSANVYLDGGLVDGIELSLQAEPDSLHYGGRGFPAGLISPESEALLLLVEQALGGRGHNGAGS